MGRRLLLLVIFLAACSDPPAPGQEDAGQSVDLGAAPDVGTVDDVGAGDLGFSDGGLGDVGPTDRGGPVDQGTGDTGGDAGAGLDLSFADYGPADQGFGVQSCDPPVVVDQVNDDVLQPILRTQGAEVALLYTHGAAPPFAAAAQVGDGDTFGAPRDVITGLIAPVAAPSFAFAPGGRVGVAGFGPSSTEIQAGILAADHQTVGAVSSYPISGLSDPRVVASTTELLALLGHSTAQGGEGLDLARAALTSFGPLTNVGSRPIRPSFYDLALDDAGNGVAVVGTLSELSLVAVRGHAPVAAVANATVAGSIFAVRVLALPNDVALLLVVEGDANGTRLFEREVHYTAAGPNLSLRPPRLLLPRNASDQLDVAVDPTGRITLAYYGNGRAWARRKLRGTWQPVQDLGAPFALGPSPVVRLDAAGNATVLVTSATPNVSELRQAPVDASTFGPGLPLPTGSFPATVTPHPGGGLVAAWAAPGVAGVHDVVAARCR